MNQVAFRFNKFDDSCSNLLLKMLFIWWGWNEPVTYPWPKNGDNDDKMGYDGQEPSRDETIYSRHDIYLEFTLS